MKIKTLGNKIQLDIEQPKAGDLALGSTKVAKECAKVVSIGPDVTLPVKQGDTVLFKSWAVDIIEHDGKFYYFLDTDTKGLCAIITK